MCWKKTSFSVRDWRYLILKLWTHSRQFVNCVWVLTKKLPFFPSTLKSLMTFVWTLEFEKRFWARPNFFSHHCNYCNWPFKGAVWNLHQLFFISSISSIILNKNFQEKLWINSKIFLFLIFRNLISKTRLPK